MQPRQRPRIPGGCLLESSCVVSLGQRELGFLADAHVWVRQQLREFGSRALSHSRGDQAPGFKHELIGIQMLVVHAIDPAFSRLVPAGHPIGNVKATVDSEILVGAKDLPNKLALVDQLEPGTFRLHCERMNAAARATAEIAQEEVFPVAVRQTCAGKIGQAGRFIGKGRNGRNNKSGLSIKLRIAKALGHPNTAGVRRVDKLVTHAPSTVATFHNVDPARRIAAVGIVVAREKISVLVEREFLRIAQAARENLQVRTIRVAAKDRAHLGFFDDIRAVLYVEAAITDTEIKPAVRTKAQAVQIMSEKAGADAVTALQGFFHISSSGACGVLKQVEVGNACVPNLAAAGQKSRADAIVEVVEAVRKDGGLIGFAVAIAIDQQANAIS